MSESNQLEPNGPSPMKLLTAMAMTKAIWGRLDSWVGQTILTHAWGYRQEVASKFLGVIHIADRYVDLRDLSERYGCLPNRLLENGSHILPSTGKLETFARNSPLLKINGEYVYVAYQRGQGIVSFYTRPSAKAMLAEFLATVMVTQRIHDIGCAKEFTAVGVAAGGTYVTWNATHSLSLQTKLDQLPIHSEVRIELMRIVAEIELAWWLHDGKTREQMFRDRALTLNVLLHGPRGSGKTSIAYALSQELEVKAYRYPTPEQSDDFWRLCTLMDSQSVVVADEADTKLFTGKSEVAIDVRSGGQQRASVIDTLAYLTGPRQPSGILTVICTNKPEAFDPRVTREGRIHKNIEVGKVDHAGLVYWFTKNYPEVDITGMEFKPVLMTRVFTLMREHKLPELVARELTKEQHEND